MIEVRQSQDRHHETFGWLDTKWSFSFDSYYDPAHTSFGPLLVFNDDLIQPATGFPMHPHQDMEILTFVMEGAIQHEDSAGNRTTIRAGDVQRMTAGTGIRHSERNPSSTEPTHLFQVWILPERTGLPPSYEQQAFPVAERDGRLLPVVSRTPNGHALHIHQDVTMYRAHLDTGRSVSRTFAPGRRGYLFIISGRARANSTVVEAGDVAKISAEAGLEILAEAGTELLFFDLP